MSETDPIEIGVDKETENYAVFESADGDTIVGMYVSDGAAEALGEFATLTISDEADVSATLDKTTTNYAVYSTEGGAVSGMYVSLDLLEDTFGAEDTDEDEESQSAVAPESIGLTLTPSDEDAFEDAAGVDEEEEEALVADAESSDETDESEEEEVEISDEEVGLVDAE